MPTERNIEILGVRMNLDFDQDRCRKPYAPPQIVTISLRPEEAVLGHCKISGGSGPQGGSITGPCEILLGGCTPLGS
jgi:hypothetical protein